MSTDKKYLIITPFFPNKDNYMGSYIFDQIKAISHLSSYEVIILKTVPFFSSEKDYIYKGYKVYIFKVIDFPFFILPGIFDYYNGRRLISFVESNQIQNNLTYVHAHVSYPAVYLATKIAKKFNIVSFAQHHGLDVLQLKNGRYNWIRRLNRCWLTNNTIKKLNLATMNIGVSQLVLDKLHNFESYHPQNEMVLYNGVDREKFFPIKNPLNKNFLIGCVGNFWEIKDHMTLIKAVQYLINNKGIKDIEVRFVGTGVTLGQCKRYVKANNLASYISFFSEKRHTSLNKFYNELDLFVLPSYYEAFGCVYLEAWATDTPFIAVEGQGIQEIMDEKSKKHCLFKKRDSIALSKRILEFYHKRISVTYLNDNIDINYIVSQFLREIE